jgi:4-hydroxybenzoate polyprenyltransferase
VLVGLIRLSHPFPSLLNALATAGIALLAGGDLAVAGRLGAAMLCLQASIGAVNDLADLEVDAVSKPGKPIPAGLVTPTGARWWAAGTAAGCLMLGAPSGPATILVGGACLALGYLYDLRLSRTALSWLPLALALPLLPVFAWIGATGDVPSSLLVLVPIAMLAGGALLVANGIVDAERDVLAGKATAAVRLGRTAAWLAHAVVLVVAVALAIVLAPNPSPAGPPEGTASFVLRALRSLGVPFGALAIATGLMLLRAARPGIRERGWELEAIGTAVLGLGWLAGTAIVGAGGASG